MADTDVQIVELSDKEGGSPPPPDAVAGSASVPTTAAEANGEATDLKNGSMAEADKSTKSGGQEPQPSVKKGLMPEEFALNEVLQQLTAGSEMTKIKSRGKRFVRQYRISRDLHYLCWWPSRKGASHSRSECSTRAFLCAHVLLYTMYHYMFNCP